MLAVVQHGSGVVLAKGTVEVIVFLLWPGGSVFVVIFYCSWCWCGWLEFYWQWHVAFGDYVSHSGKGFAVLASRERAGLVLKPYSVGNEKCH